MKDETEDISETEKELYKFVVKERHCTDERLNGIDVYSRYKQLILMGNEEKFNEVADEENPISGESALINFEPHPSRH